MSRLGELKHAGKAGLIAIPVFLNQRERAAEAAAQANLRTAATAQESYYADEGTYTNNPDDLTDYGFRQGDPEVAIPSAAADGYCMEAGGFHLDSDEGTVQPPGAPFLCLGTLFTEVVMALAGPPRSHENGAVAS
jgi:type II secretory pathway pseudopilin PulG